MNYSQPVLARLPQDAADQPHMLDIIHRFETALRVKIITPEVEIILALFEHSPTTIAVLQAGCRASPTKFYAVLKDLQDRGMLGKRADPEDGRRNLYELSAEARAFIHDVYGRQIEAFAAVDLEDNARLLAAIEEARKYIGNHYGIAFTSFRYNILSSLFKLGHWHPSDGQKLAETSQVSFYAAMEDLKSIGAIECFDDPDDRRKKRCRLTSQTRDVFSHTIRSVISHMLDNHQAGACAVAPLALLFLHGFAE